MEQSKIHRITVNIVGVEPFKLPVKENEESFYRSIIERINENCKNHDIWQLGRYAQCGACQGCIVLCRYAVPSDTSVQEQRSLLQSFEERIDTLLAGTD